MSPQEQKAEQKTESSGDTLTKAAENVVKEASAGKEELVSGIKKAIEILKSGGRSGITNEFGKPLLIDMGGPGGHEGQEKTPRKFQTGEIPLVKSQITGETRDREPGHVSDVGGRTGAGTGGASESRTPGEPVSDVRTHGTNRDAGASHVPESVTNSAGSRTTDSTPVSHTTDSAPGAATDSRPTGTDSSSRTSDAAAHPGAQPTEAVSTGHGDHVVRMRPETIRVSADAAYQGEVINRDVNPSTHTMARGETLQQVAREHLGAGATDEQVQAHVREIERVNHIRNHHVNTGQELTLPGHTHDGGFVTNDVTGATHTRWHDGAERIENPNGSGRVRHPSDDGSYTEHHWGRNPEDNYDIARTADGHYRVADRPGDQPQEPTNPNDQRVEHARLNDIAESRITNPAELARFRADMDQFEQRAREQHLPPSEVANTYREIGRLLEHEGDRPVPESRRRELAEQVMHQAAHPTSIDQGYHNTCNVTTVESRLYTRNPSEAARLVTDVATTGQFTAHDGTVVHVPANSLSPDPEGRNNPPHAGDRSFASQVFQVSTLNMYHQTEPFHYTDSHGREHTVPPGGMRYEQHTPRPGHPDDTGERLIDTTTRPPHTVGRGADITDDGIVHVNNRLTGETGHDVMIDHADDVYGDSNGVSTVRSEQELNDRVAQAAADGRLPIIVRVNTDNEPWLHDSGAGAAGGSGGAHVVTITGYEAGPPSRVHVDNQWGDQNDYQGSRTLSVHDLYLSMRPSTDANQVADLQRDVDWDRAHNTIDTRKEFEVLRLRHNLPSTDPSYLNDADYNRMTAEQIDAAGQRWTEQRANGTFNQAEHDNAMQKLSDMSRNQPPDRRLNWIEHCHTSGVIDDQTYDRSLSNAMQSARQRWADEDRHHTGNQAERRQARQEMEQMLNALPEDRRRVVMANSR